MPADFLHRHKDFASLLRIVADQMKVQPVLVEKDYWIMHCLYGLQQLEMAFELKGGTSLSIRRVFNENFQVYGVRKVWRQLQRGGFDIARLALWQGS